MSARLEPYVLPHELRRPPFSYVTLVIAILSSLGFIVAGVLMTSMMLRVFWFCTCPLPILADTLMERLSWRGQRARAALKLYRELGANGTLKGDVQSVPVFGLRQIHRSDDAYAPGGE